MHRHREALLDGGRKPARRWPRRQRGPERSFGGDGDGGDGGVGRVGGVGSACGAGCDTLPTASWRACAPDRPPPAATGVAMLPAHVVRGQILQALPGVRRALAAPPRARPPCPPLARDPRPRRAWRVAVCNPNPNPYPNPNPNPNPNLTLTLTLAGPTASGHSPPRTLGARPAAPPPPPSLPRQQRRQQSRTRRPRTAATASTARHAASRRRSAGLSDGARRCLWPPPCSLARPRPTRPPREA